MTTAMNIAGPVTVALFSFPVALLVTFVLLQGVFQLMFTRLRAERSKRS